MVAWIICPDGNMVLTVRLRKSDILSNSGNSLSIIVVALRPGAGSDKGSKPLSFLFLFISFSLNLFSCSWKPISCSVLVLNASPLKDSAAKARNGFVWPRASRISAVVSCDSAILLGVIFLDNSLYLVLSCD